MLTLGEDVDDDTHIYISDCTNEIEWAAVQLYDADTFELLAETYLFIVSEEPFVQGDCNGDGVFNVADALLLQKWLLAVPDTHFANWEAADLCKDGELNVFDLYVMKSKLIDG